MRNLLLLLTLTLGFLSSHGQKLVEVKPDSLFVDFDMVENGGYNYVFLEGNEFSRHSKVRKADATAFMLRALYPDADVLVSTPDARPVGRLKFFLFESRLNGDIPSDSLIAENLRLNELLVESLLVNDSLIAKNKELSDDVLYAYNLNDSLLVDIERINALLDESLELNDSLLVDIQKLNVSLLESENLNNELRNQNSQLSNDLLISQELNQTLSTENESLKATNNTLSAQIETLNTTNNTLTTEIESLTTTNNTLVTQNESLSTTNNSLTSINNTLTTEIESLTTTNNTLVTQNESLSATNNTLVSENVILNDSIQYLVDNWPKVNASIITITEAVPPLKYYELDTPIEGLALGNACDTLIKPLQVLSKNNFDFADKPVILRNATWTIMGELLNNGVRIDLIDAIVQELIILECPSTSTVVFKGPQIDSSNLIRSVDTIMPQWVENGDNYTYDATVSNKYLVFNTDRLTMGKTYELSFDVITDTPKAQFDLWAYQVEGQIPDSTYTDPRISTYSLGSAPGKFKYEYTVSGVERDAIGIRAQSFGGPFTISNVQLVEKTIWTGLTSYYDFNEESGDLLDKVGNRNGLIVGATQGEIGISGGSYSFSNGAHVAIPFSDELHLKYTGQWTVSAWFYDRDISLGGTIVAMAKRDTAGKQYQVVTTNSTLNTNIGGRISPYSSLSGLGNQWNHVVLTCDNGVGKNYVNGVLMDTFTTGTNTDAQGVDTTIGVRRDLDNTDFGWAFDGFIDELAIFNNRTWTLEEIQEAYNNGLGLFYNN